MHTIFDATIVEAAPETDLVVIDITVEGFRELINGVAPETGILFIENASDLEMQLASYRDLGSLTILSHGQPGALLIGSDRISCEAMDDYRGLMRKISAALSDTGTLVLYGCEIALGAEGKAFISALEDAVGAQVAASETLTGHPAHGGDWRLDGAADMFPVQKAFKGEVTGFSHVLGPSPGTIAWANEGTIVALSQDPSTNDVQSSGLNVQVFTTGGSGAQIEVDNGGNFGDAVTGGSDASLQIDVPNDGTALDEIRLVSSDGAEFQLDSFVLGLTAVSSSAVMTVTITGYRDGSAVSGASVTYASSSNTSGTSVNGHGAVTFGSDWENIDEIRIAYTSGPTGFNIAIDDIVTSTAVAGNSAPELGGTPADETATEDVATAIDLSAYNVTDADGDTITLTLAVDRGTIASVDGNGTHDGVTVATSGTASMTLQGTAANLNTYLNDTSHITYTTASNDTTAATLTVTPNDGTANGTADTVTINISAANDAPVLDNTQSPTLSGITEDAGDDDGSGADGDDDATSNANNTGTTVASLVVDGSITDVDGSAVEAIAVTAIDNTNGVWQYSTDSGTNWNNFSGTTGSSVDISSTARLLASTAVVRFVPDANYNGSATITFRAWDQSSGSSGGTADTSSNGGTTAFSTATDTASVTVSGVNDAPAFSGLDATPSFTEGGSAVVLDSNVTVADSELGSLNSGNGNFAGATLTIARNGGANASDAFSIVTGGNLTVSGSNVSAGGNVIATFDTSSSGQVTISFANNGTVPTTALVNEVMQAVRYSNSADDPSSSVQLDWTFSDGNSGNAQGTGDNPGTTTGSVTVSVTNVNDAPTLTATGANPTYVEGATASDVFSGVSASTVESTDRIASMNLTVTNVTDGSNEILEFDGTDVALTNGNSVTTATNSLGVSVSVSDTTATVSFSSETLTSAQFQTLIDALGYRNTSDNPTTGSNRVITVTGITDNGGTANSGTDAASPNITSTVSLTAVNDAPVVSNIFGDSGSSVTAGAGAQNVSDLDDVTVTNADSDDYNGGFVTIAQSSGTTNGSWSVDGTTVTSGGDATVSAGETIQVSGVTIGTVNATDDGQGGNDFTINFSSSSATSANIQTLLRNLNYSGPSGIDTRAFTLTLNDNDGTANGGDQDASGSFSLSVAPNPPVIGNLGGDSLTFTEGDSATDLDVGGNVTVTDADSTDFDGGSVSVTYQSGQQAEDRLVIDVSGSVSLSAGQASGSTVSVSGTGIGTIQASNTGGSNEGLVITLNSSATPALVQTLLGAIQYNNTGGDNPTDGNRTVRVTVSDGDGATSANADITVNVDPVNDLPTGADGTETTNEDTTYTFSAADFGFSDADTGDSLSSVRIDTLPGSSVGTLQLSGSNVTAGDTITAANIPNLTFVPASNVNGTGATSFTFSVNDGTAFDSSANTITIDITAVEDAPTVSGLGALTVTEDTASNLDLSGVTVADVDTTGNITVTITATDTGAVLAAVDGAGVGSGVTETASGNNVVTLVGTAADINTYLDTASNITYTTSSNNTAADTLSIQATDGVSTPNAASTATVTISAVNDDPTGTGLPSDVGFTEDTAGNLDLSSVTLADVDAGSSNVTLTLAASEGTLAATSGGGVTIANSGTATITLTGTIANIDTYLNTASNIQYTPTLNDNGGDTATVTVSINDGGNTGSGGGTTLTLGTVNIDITAVNDAPAGTDGSGSLDTNNTFTFAASNFGFTDVDSGNSLVRVRIDTLSLDNGSLALSGTAVNAGDVIALADIPNLVYTPSEAGTDSFTFSVNDGTDYDATPATFTLNVAQGNLPPANLSLTGGVVAENAAGAVVGTLSATDPNGDSVTFASLDSRFVVEGTTLRLAPGVSLDYEATPTTRVNVSASDAAGATHSAFLQVTVTNVIDTVVQTGGDSDDTLDGSDENDRIDGGRGNDNVRTSNGRDTIDGGDGDDTLDGGNDDDLIEGGTGDDSVMGGNGRDTLRGGEGNDTVDGGDDDDTIFSGNDDIGDDHVSGDNGNDTVGGGRGNDSVVGGFGDDVMYGGRGDGIDNDDTVSGDEGNDTLFGGSGDDTVLGGDGDDELWGGAGDDNLSGGAGADTFIFGATSGNDTVSDFDATEDTINLAFAATDFASMAEVTAAASDVTQNGQSGVLIDLGNGESVFIIGITASDLNTDNVVF